MEARDTALGAGTKVVRLANYIQEKPEVIRRVMKLGRERPSRSLVDNPTSWTKPPIGSPVLKYGVTPKFGRVYGDIHLGTGLIAGNSLEPYSPKRNRSKDWTISSEAFIDLEERSPMLSSVPNALRG